MSPVIESFWLIPLPPSATDCITGNASQATKEAAVKWQMILQTNSYEFGFEAGRKIKILEVWVEGNPDRPGSIPDSPNDTEREERIRQGVQESSQVRVLSEVVVEPGQWFWWLGPYCNGEV
jgi:hypothetical protein